MKRISSLEGLRGLATVMVLFSHLGVIFYPAYYWGGTESHNEILEYIFGSTPLAFLFSGNSAVMIFLILTGFGSYMVCDRGREYCVKYASLRFFKLSILMFCSTIIIWLLFKFQLVYYYDIIEDTCTIWIQGYSPFNNNLSSLVFDNWFSVSSRYNGTLWTMQSIFSGSIICVLIYCLWGNLNGAWMPPLIIGFFFVIMGMCYYVAPILGYTLACCYKKGIYHQISIKAGLGMLAIGIFLCGFPMVNKSEFVLYCFLPQGYVEYYHIIGAYLLVYACLFSVSIKKAIGNKIFVALGKYSMSIYILHFAVLISITSYLFMKLKNLLSYNIVVLIVWMITMVVTCGLAIPLKKIIEMVYNIMDNGYEKLVKLQQILK